MVRMKEYINEDKVEYLPPKKDGPGFVYLWNILAILPVFILLSLAWVWFYWRIEPGSGEIAVLIRKTGLDLPSGQIIATEANQKGIHLDVLPEGRYFRNPYTWNWMIENITDIPAGKLGVQIRQFGQDLKTGEIVAEETQKGIVSEILRPGKYRINPYAYSVILYDAISVHPGHVGIVTNLAGKDSLYQKNVESQNTFLVKEGEKGVQTHVLDPGTYYLNPFLVNVTEVNLQSQRFDFSGKDSINFLSLDGFNITVEGTIEWAIEREKASMITVRVGDLEDILNKIIMPRARGFSRIEGSKKIAAEYITGITRQEFQDNLFKHLKETCEERGVKILSALIRNIVPPQAIASLIREKEIAVQDRRKYEQQILEAQSAAELGKQDQLAIQNREKVEQETIKIKAVIEVQQVQSVALTEARKNLEVAKIENQSAEFKISAKMAGGEAQRDVIGLQNQANSKILQGYVNAFGSGWNYAYYQFLRKVSPKLQFIFANEKGIFGAIFEEFSKQKK
jgi:regulator of protease activity HflC (stomatin/prohibitin superfamily)